MERQPAVKESIRKLKDKFVPGVKYTLLLSGAFNFAMLVIGCLNVHRCPVNKHIPLFLIATGAIGLVSKFTSYVRERLSKHIQVLYLESALYSVESVFFFLGTYWVYKEFKPSYNPSDKYYCNKTAYLFAFIYITIYYAILLAIVLGFCCFLCCACCLAAAATSNDVENPTAPAETTVALNAKTEEEAKI